MVSELQHAIFMGAYDGLLTRTGGQNMDQCCRGIPKGIRAAGIE
jgi:hypothetical protein